MAKIDSELNWSILGMMMFTPDKKIKSHGSLLLRDMMEERLKLPKGSITGQWDGSHCLQLAYSDVLKKFHTNFLSSTILTMYQVMKNYISSKARTLFKEFADDGGHNVIKMQVDLILISASISKYGLPF